MAATAFLEDVDLQCLLHRKPNVVMQDIQMVPNICLHTFEVCFRSQNHCCGLF